MDDKELEKVRVAALTFSHFGVVMNDKESLKSYFLGKSLSMYAITTRITAHIIS